MSLCSHFSDLERVREGLGDKCSFAIQFVAAFFAGFAIGFWKGWKLALVMMSLTPLLAVCAAFMMKVSGQLNFNNRYQILSKGVIESSAAFMMKVGNAPLNFDTRYFNNAQLNHSEIFFFASRLLPFELRHTEVSI